MPSDGIFGDGEYWSRGRQIRELLLEKRGAAVGEGCGSSSGRESVTTVDSVGSRGEYK